MYWKCDEVDGFNFVDLTDITKSAEATCFSSNVMDAQFHLVSRFISRDSNV